MTTAIDKLKDDLSNLIQFWRQSRCHRDNSYDAGRDDAFTEASNSINEILKEYIPKLVCELHNAKDGKVEWEAEAINAINDELESACLSPNVDKRIIGKRLATLIQRTREKYYRR